MKIIRIVGKFRNCGIISSLLICEFLKICWDIFKNFNVENLFYWIIGNVGIVEIVETIGKFWNFGMIVLSIIFGLVGNLCNIGDTCE